jgi:hypothetical protein
VVRSVRDVRDMRGGSVGDGKELRKSQSAGSRCMQGRYLPKVQKLHAMCCCQAHSQSGLF